ncbi:MAG: hypothetical protein AB7F79_01740 [Steroidobacteraceae bacterium]
MLDPREQAIKHAAYRGAFAPVLAKVAAEILDVPASSSPTIIGLLYAPEMLTAAADTGLSLNLDIDVTIAYLVTLEADRAKKQGLDAKLLDLHSKMAAGVTPFLSQCYDPVVFPLFVDTLLGLWFDYAAARLGSSGVPADSYPSSSLLRGVASSEKLDEAIELLVSYILGITDAGARQKRSLELYPRELRQEAFVRAKSLEISSAAAAVFLVLAASNSVKQHISVIKRVFSANQRALYQHHLAMLRVDDVLLTRYSQDPICGYLNGQSHTALKRYADGIRAYLELRW